MRLFIALNLPPVVHDALAKVQSDLQRQVVSPALRWMKPENAHLTLLFLGEVANELVPEIAEQLFFACAPSSSFSLKLAGAGCFPNMQRPRVLWLGLGGDLDALHLLQQNVQTNCEHIAERREDKAFRPHLTLARIKFGEPLGMPMLQEALGALYVDGTEWRVDSVELMQSEIRKSGSRYSTLRTIPLRRDGGS